MPLLKFVAGQSVGKSHLQQLFKLLKLAKDKDLNKLIFKDLVLAMPDMVKKTKEIKELAEKA